ncbi:MAG: maleylacetoacetate isomerase [Novosphingobium sp.]
MSDVILYDYWRSSACYRVRIVLNLKGIAYRAEQVDLVEGEQVDDDYISINPQALIPALAIDGHVLTQSLAIIDYLDAMVSEPRMVSRDPAARAKTLARALTLVADVHPLNNLRVLNRLRADFGADGSTVHRWAAGWIARGFEALEAEAPDSGLFGGDAPDLSDVCLVPQMYSARRFDLDFYDYPKLCRIDAQLRAMDAFAHAAPEAVHVG